MSNNANFLTRDLTSPDSGVTLYGSVHVDDGAEIDVWQFDTHINLRLGPTFNVSINSAAVCDELIEHLRKAALYLRREKPLTTNLASRLVGNRAGCVIDD